MDDTLCDVIGCYGYDVNSAAAAAQGAKDKDWSSQRCSASGSYMYMHAVAW